MILDDYIIPFGGLSEGEYEFIFQAGNEFFEYYNNPDILGGNITINVSLLRKNSYLILNISVSGILKLICDRCLEEFNASIDTSGQIYVRFGEKPGELSDNVIVIPRTETRLNISQYIYEFSALEIPIQKVHPPDEKGNQTCNIEMVKLLEKYSPENKEINPVWNDEKNILN